MAPKSGVTVSGSTIPYYTATFSGTVRQDYYASIYNKGIPLKPNRWYTLSLLVYYDFPNATTELDLGVRTKNGTISVYSSTNPTTVSITDYNNDGILRQDVNGVMGVSGSGTTATWMRWTSTFVSTPFSGTGFFQVVPRFRGTGPGTPLNSPPVFCVADARLIEHAPIAYPPNPSGTLPIADDPRVLFPGSTGKFHNDMKITYGPVPSGSDAYDVTIKVGTSGCMFAIDTKNDYISVRHDITTQKYRTNVYFPPDALYGLRQISGTSASSTVCILGNENVTIGIHGDSLMMIAPNHDMDLKVRGRIGGEWNRFFAGNLYSVDTDGGFCVNPIIPLGSGSTCQYVPVTMPNPNFLDKHNNTTFTGSATSNWEIKYQLKRGERLGVGAFPPRKFKWEESFHSNYALVQMGANDTYTSVDKKMSDLSDEGVDIVVLWESFFNGAWSAGGECGLFYQLKDKEKMRLHLQRAKANNLTPIVYLSPRFYHSEDMGQFMDAVQALIDEFGTDLEGVYYDGTPFDWVASYEVMRMTRAKFPDGVIILHSSMSAPCYMPDILSPFIDTYADITLRGETVPGPGDVIVGTEVYDSINWPFPKYAASQYNIANCVGMIKGSQWKLHIPSVNPNFSGTNPMFGKTDLPQALKMLQYGGRGRYLEKDEFNQIYFPILRDVTKLPEEYRANIFIDGTGLQWSLYDTWEYNKDNANPNYYKDLYLPQALDLTKEFLQGID